MNSLPFEPARLDTIDPSTLCEGEVLPVLEIPITTTLIVCGAIASRDFYVGHHDRQAAQAAGSPDVFMNIMATGALVSRFLTDWAGPDAELRQLDLRLGAPNYPGDAMTLEGSVMRTERTVDGAWLVEIRFAGRNGRGTHAMGTALLGIPSRREDEEA